jgi:hypothetical protein
LYQDPSQANTSWIVWYHVIMTSRQAGQIS